MKHKRLTISLIIFLLAVFPAVALAGSAILHWQPNSDPDLAGYRIYYGTQSRKYGPYIPVDKDVTSYTLNGLVEGNTYYFALTAVDTSGNESGFSAEVSKDIAGGTVPPPSGTAMAGHDFNGDGSADILWRHYGNGVNVIWLMNGTNVAKSDVFLPSVSDTKWRIESIGDFNGDGSADILWRHYGNGVNVIWLMNGTNVAKSDVFLPSVSDTKWRIESIGDFNGDGSLDLLWRHYGLGANMIWLMNGTSVLRNDVSLPTVSDLKWQIEGVGDFNRDGSIDILWRHLGAGVNVIWLMNGTNVAKSDVFLPSVSDTKWRIESIEDFNRDGSVDLLWRHYGAGANMIWLMNGTSVLRNDVSLPSVSDLKWEDK